MRVPSEGDVIELDLPHSAGHEQRGRRPGVVVSIAEFQGTGFALVCPITTHGGKAVAPRSEMEVPIPPGFAVSGVILPHQIRSFDWKARNAEVVDHLPRITLQHVRARLKLYLGL